jgi:hypothetical protein
MAALHPSPRLPTSPSHRLDGAWSRLEGGQLSALPACTPIRNVGPSFVAIMRKGVSHNTSLPNHIPPPPRSVALTWASTPHEGLSFHRIRQIS